MSSQVPPGPDPLDNLQSFIEDVLIPAEEDLEAVLPKLETLLDRLEALPEQLEHGSQEEGAEGSLAEDLEEIAARLPAEAAAQALTALSEAATRVAATDLPDLARRLTQSGKDFDTMASGAQSSLREAAGSLGEHGFGAVVEALQATHGAMAALTPAIDALRTEVLLAPAASMERVSGAMRGVAAGAQTVATHLETGGQALTTTVEALVNTLQERTTILVQSHADRAAAMAACYEAADQKIDTNEIELGDGLSGVVEGMTEIVLRGVDALGEPVRELIDYGDDDHLGALGTWSTLLQQVAERANEVKEHVPNLLRTRQIAERAREVAKAVQQ